LTAILTGRRGREALFARSSPLLIAIEICSGNASRENTPLLEKGEEVSA
jgi:hypothetical protein